VFVSASRMDHIALFDPTFRVRVTAPLESWLMVPGTLYAELINRAVGAKDLHLGFRLLASIIALARRSSRIQCKHTQGKRD
jgi:hypothetical protein